MSRNRVWIYAAVLFVLVATILSTQVSWILQSAKIEESFLSQRVNMALCSAMDVLSKDRGLCSSVESCVAHGPGTFEMAFTKQDKQKIDSVIQRHLWFYNIHVPFETTLLSYTSDTVNRPLPLSQALLFPAKAGIQNVLVHIEIPSKSQIIRSQVNTTFILSVAVLTVLICLFIGTIRALIREKKIRKETVDFINTMAHDLKTPISNISFAASLLSRDQQSSIASKQFVSIIETEAARLKERARKILGAASVDAVLDDSSDQSELDIHDMIMRSIDSFQLKLESSKGVIKKDFQATHSIVKGNSLQLASAFMNIIDNAITYSKDGCIISVRTRNDTNGIIIEIADNGPGIPCNEQELVFKRAYRVRNGGKMPEGFGLGLYLAKTSVEKNGGKLSMLSDGMSGSSFFIQLPLL
jgi:two-component system, OmpR family, phosphate regulon sensor histidine kinase PhoR